MTLIRPTAEATDAGGPARRPGPGRAVAVLVLVVLAVLIPLFGPSAALHGTGEAAAPGAGGVALLRTVLFAALCVPLGELFAARLARSVPGAPADTPRSWAPYATVAGLVAALGLASFVATGDLVPHSLSEIDVGGLYESRDGKLALLEVNAFLVAALCARSPRLAGRLWPLAAVIVAEALRAHPPAEHSPLIGSGLTLVHLTCAALWAGGLLHVLRTLRLWGAVESGPSESGPSESGPAESGRLQGPGSAGWGAALIGLYARLAAVLLAAITATGVWSSLRRMPPDTILEQLTDTAYGRVLLAKMLLVAVVAALALWARTRLRRAPDPLTACVPARVEVVALALVVVISGLLTALPHPIRW